MILQADFLGNVNIMFITPAQTIEYECRKAGGAFLALLGEDRLVSGEPWRKTNKSLYDNCVTQKTSRTM